MTKPADETTPLSETPTSPELEAFEAKAARLSSIPTTEDIRRRQEAEMNETQRALLSYVVSAEPEPVEGDTEVETVPNKLPSRVVSKGKVRRA